MRTPQIQPARLAGARTACAVLLAAAVVGAAPLAATLVGGSARDPVAPLLTVSLPASAPGSGMRSALGLGDEDEEAVVVMADGTRYTGNLIEQTDEGVVIEVGGIRLRLRASEVSRVILLPPVRERYERLRTSIADDDVPALLGLVEWLISRREYALADEELIGVQRREPRHPRAAELRRLIEAQRLLEGLTPNPADDPAGRTTPRTERQKDQMPVLSAEEINLIRVYELDLDRMPRVVIRRDTIERLIEEYRGDPLIPTTAEGREQLFRAARTNPRRIVEIIFRLKARHLYGEIQVIDNPRAMQLFRDRVHRTWLINACGSCHNTRPDAPRGPRLITRHPNADATVYSNFLIIDRYRLPGGVPLINYEDPAASPLLHLGLPRANSAHPHPTTAASRGWSPVFLSPNANAYQHAIEWIGALYQPRPEYPINYPVDMDRAGELDPHEPIER